MIRIINIANLLLVGVILSHCTGSIDGGPDAKTEDNLAHPDGGDVLGDDTGGMPSDGLDGFDADNDPGADNVGSDGDGSVGVVAVLEDAVSISGAPNNPYTRVRFENPQIVVTFLPRLGGRLYELIYKPTGHNELYKNSIWKPIPNWGVNPCRNGNWEGIGGMEFALPEQEHGCIYDEAFEYQVIQNADGSATMRVTKNPDDALTYGLKLTVEMTLWFEHPYVKIQSTIENPSNNTVDKNFQFWINAMVVPGDRDPRDANFEFMFPASTTSMVVHSSSVPGLSEHQQVDWPGVYNVYNNWKGQGWLGAFFATPSYQVGYSHVDKEGLVRVLKNGFSGLKLFALGTIGTDAYTDNGRQYIELWSGLTQDFWSYTSLAKGSSTSLTEYWYPISFDTDPTDLRSAIEASISSIIPP